MKKNLNTFRTVRQQNILRFVVAACAVLVVVSLVLVASLPENRQRLFHAFKKDTALEPRDTFNQAGDQAGLQDGATVNEALEARPLDHNDHLLGDLSAPVKIMIYEDYQCPFCAQLYDSLEQARSEFGTKIVIGVRNYPMSIHELAVPAANAAECAAEQQVFPEAYKALFAANKSQGLSQDFLSSLGTTLKIDEAQYRDCLTKAKYNDKILAEKEEVKKLGVIGTPALFINGRYHAGALPFDDFSYPDGSLGKGLKSLISEQLK